MMMMICATMKFFSFWQDLNKGCVSQSHCGLAIYIKKYLKAKEELWKFKYFTMQKYNLPKTKIL
jgi:hypothetical protein